jgi:excisionase family DNA binding protein
MNNKTNALEYATSILSPYMPEVTPAKLENALTVTGGFEQRYKIKQVAALLQCSIKHVHNLIDRGELKAERGAGIIRIKASELDRILV